MTEEKVAWQKEQEAQREASLIDTRAVLKEELRLASADAAVAR